MVQQQQQHQLLFIDIETTGLNRRKNEIIDIWCALVNEDTLEIVEEGGGLVTPLYVYNASPAALEINGYTPERWATSRSWEEVWGEIRHLFNGTTPIVGSNPIFDMRFIMQYDRQTYIPPLIDTVELARSQDIQLCSLDALCARYDVDRAHVAHTARGDVYRCIEVYRHLVGFA